MVGGKHILEMSCIGPHVSYSLYFNSPLPQPGILGEWPPLGRPCRLVGEGISGHHGFVLGVVRDIVLGVVRGIVISESSGDITSVFLGLVTGVCGQLPINRCLVGVYMGKSLISLYPLTSS